MELSSKGMLRSVSGCIWLFGVLCLPAFPALSQESGPSGPPSPPAFTAQPVAAALEAQFEVAVPLLDAGESPGVAVTISSDTEIADGRIEIALSREGKAIYNASRDTDLVAGATRISFEIDPSLLTPGDYTLTGKVIAGGKEVVIPDVTLRRLDLPGEIDAAQKAEQSVQDLIRRAQSRIDPDRFRADQKPDILKALRLFALTTRMQAVQRSLVGLRSNEGQITPEILKAREQLPAHRKALNALKEEGAKIDSGGQGDDPLESVVATPGLPALWDAPARTFALLYGGTPVAQVEANVTIQDPVARAQEKKNLFAVLGKEGCTIEEDSIAGFTGNVVFRGDQIERVIVDIQQTGYTLRGPELGVIRGMMETVLAGRGIREEDILRIAQEMPSLMEVDNLDRILSFDRSNAIVFPGNRPSEEDRQLAEMLAGKLNLPLVTDIKEARKSRQVVLTDQKAAEQLLLRYRVRLPRSPDKGKIIGLKWEGRDALIVAGSSPQARRDAALTLLDALQVLPGCELYVGDLHVHTRVSSGSPAPWEAIGASVAGMLDFVALADDNTQAGYDEVSSIISNRQLRITVLPGEELIASWGHLLAYGLSKPVLPGSDPRSSLEAIHQGGGLAVLAHPGTPEPVSPWAASVLENPKAAGVDGVEVSPRSAQAAERWQESGEVPLMLGSSGTKTASFTYPVRTLIFAKNDRPETLLAALKAGNAVAYWQGRFFGPLQSRRLVSLLMQDRNRLGDAFWRRLARRAKSL